MNLLIVHQNFPGQFRHLAGALESLDNWTVVGLGESSFGSLDASPRCVRYRSRLSPKQTAYPPILQLEDEIRQGESARAALRRLRNRGFDPDCILAHPGWGEVMFLRDVFPKSPFVAYLEYFFHREGADSGFDPEFDQPGFRSDFIRLRNASTLLAFADADQCVTPTEWQASLFPKPMQGNLRIMHEGIDTQLARPDPSALFHLSSGRRLTKNDQVVTFVARNLEPYRGFHRFMRALPQVQKRCPEAHVLIIGGDEVSYGRPPARGTTWRNVLLEEVGRELDLERVTFAGKISHKNFLAALQISSVHVYLTYPFVLSWSLLEAMACGCAIVGSATAPVMEVIADRMNGLLVDFFDDEQLVDHVEELLIDSSLRARLGAAARQTVIDRYDFMTKSLPAYMDLLRDVGRGKRVRA